MPINLDVQADMMAGLLLEVPADQRPELLRRMFDISGVCAGCGAGNPAEPKLGCRCADMSGKPPNGDTSP